MRKTPGSTFANNTKLGNCTIFIMGGTNFRKQKGLGEGNNRLWKNH